MGVLPRTFRRCPSVALLPLALGVFLIPREAVADCSVSAGNNSTIVQTGTGHTATLDQTGSVNSAACINQSGQSAIVVVSQVAQAGAANIADITQANGINQSAYVTQNGNGNSAVIGQSQANGAITVNFSNALEQWADRGNDEDHENQNATDHNDGDDINDPNITVANPNYGAVIEQTGNANSASITQGIGSDGSYAQILQNGNANSAAITQQNTINSILGANFASIFQQGNYNSALIGQNGSNLVGTIEQTGNGESASLTQTGDNLQYHIDQSASGTQAWGSNGPGTNNGGVMVNSPLQGITVTQTSGTGVSISLHH